MRNLMRTRWVVAVVATVALVAIIMVASVGCTRSAGDGHSLDAADGSPTDVVYVDDAGNVGVGTTAPTEMLDVNGAIKIGDATNPSAGTIRYVDPVVTPGTTPPYFAGYDGSRWLSLVNDYDWYGSGSNIYSAVSGNVGIGTSSPEEKLDVDGEARCTIGAQEYFMVPKGGIIMWSDPVNIPSGWAICNGANGTPDLRDRFIVSVGDRYYLGETGGYEETWFEGIVMNLHPVATDVGAIAPVAAAVHVKIALHQIVGRLIACARPAGSGDCVIPNRSQLVGNDVGITLVERDAVPIVGCPQAVVDIAVVHVVALALVQADARVAPARDLAVVHFEPIVERANPR